MDANPAVNCAGVVSLLQVHSRKIKPGLSSHAADLQQVTADIGRLLNEAAAVVPRSLHRSSPVYLMATAGQPVHPCTTALVELLTLLISVF